MLPVVMHRMVFRGVCLVVACCLGANLAVISAAESVRPVTYEQQVRPLLKAHCFGCHGDGAELEGNLDLRLHRLLLRGGDSGAVLVAGKPADSLLWTRVRDGEMPPPEVEKKMTEEEKDLLRRWIEGGAPTLRPEPADADPNSYFTEEERSFWSFQPIRRTTPPEPRAQHRVRNPIDQFLLARLEQAGLQFAPEADRLTLVRRLYIDLHGLPPTYEEVAEFLQDSSPDAYEHLVDRLLASPRYGERWGRHWLDPAGYSESEGYTDEDTLRPDAWKYRDYVVRSFNSDKPFDRFIHEQLAGDELIGRPLQNLSAEETEWLTATGFLRMAPDGTGGSVDQNVARNEVISRTIDIVSSSLLGLTVGCAECHNHRYDPISQEDYFAMRAVFEPALNWKDWRAPAARRVSLYTDQDRQAAAAAEAKAKEIEAARDAKQAEFIRQTLDKQLAKLAPELHAPLRAALDTPVAQRTAEQKALLQRHPSVNVSAGSLYLYDAKAADELKKLAEQAAAMRGTKPKEEFIRALWEPPQQTPPQTFLFHRGLFDQPKQVVPPRPPRILEQTLAASFPVDDPALPTTGRRLAFARWLTDARQPLTSRVIVNRLWLHHFGRGLAATPQDFGFLGVRPSHPELLDWLASELVGQGWSIKRMQRLLVTSAAYRQNSLRRPEAEAVDQENRLLWRMPIRRLDAETLRDSLLAVGGRLNLRVGGPGIPVMADQVGQFVVGIENLNAGRPGAVIPLQGEEYRRSIYVQVRRSRPLSVLDPFDLPRMEPNCAVRSTSTVAPQSLFLMNGEFVVDCAQAFAERLRREAGNEAVGQARQAWQVAYGREPSAADLSAAVQFMLEQSLYFATHPPAPPTGKNAAPVVADPQREALASLCHALLSSNRFLYVD